MTPSPRPTSSANATRGAGTVLWLVRPGPAGELDRRLRAFAGTRLALVLCAPERAAADWAGAFASAASARLECCEELRAPLAREADARLPDRVWPPVERALGAGHACLLAVVSPAVLGAIVGRALSIPPERWRSLHVGPGRCVCLRDEPIGVVLRRSNVGGPEARAGTALPAGGAEAAP